MFPGSGGGGSTAEPPEVLRRFLERRPAPRPGEQCEMCATPVDEEHSHVADLENRGVLCACRSCYLLFLPQGAAWGRYRAIPERYRYTPSFAMDDTMWDRLAIPVGLAFFFYNSSLEQTIAFYPSPAGATESMLPLETWQEVEAANPALADMEPDVEALLLRRRKIRHADEHADGFEGYLVPIDACYELVGRVRQSWKGFDGGQEAWAEIDGFFARLEQRSRRVGEPDG